VAVEVPIRDRWTQQLAPVPGAARERWTQPGRIAAALLVCSAACSDQVFEPVRNGLAATARLSGTVTALHKADLLFVIDDSRSMAGEQEKLVAGFPVLRAALDALDPPVDWRVAVMTTSVDERFAPCIPGDPDAPARCAADFGASGFECVAGPAGEPWPGMCARSLPQLAGRLSAAPGTPAVLERARLSAADMDAAFARNARPPPSGSRQEQPLRALSVAFAGGGLDGFWRDDARLVAIVASDEDDCSDSARRVPAMVLAPDGTLEDECRRESESGGLRLDRLDAWERSFRSLRMPGGVRETALAAFVGLGDGTQEPGPCTDAACTARCDGPAQRAACAQECAGALRPGLCRDECASQCREFCGSRSPGRRLATAVRDLDGALSSICEPQYGTALARLAQVVGVPTRLDLLSSPVDPRALFFRVTRGGATVECLEGADYSLDTGSVPPAIVIAQGGACRLLPGDVWSVEYLAR